MVQKTVVVTGFGPFGEHKINASWEAVRLLPDMGIDGINLIIDRIPVTYKDVEEKVKQLWEEHNPILVVHVGVSSFADKLTIETVANRSGYTQWDCVGETHPTGDCCPATAGDEVICCEVDAQKICNEINTQEDKVIACVSQNAGRYLCEFIFYNSLNINRKRTIFVHVPCLDKPFNAQELAHGIKKIIEAALQQISDCQ